MQTSGTYVKHFYTAPGTPPYAVYRAAGRTEAEICAAVRAAGRDAYGKLLDTTSDPNSYIRQNCFG